MDNSTENRWVLYGLLAAGLIFSVVAACTGIPAGGADNYAHYNISRWAFKYPHLFLDHWGKPVFTILTAPVAQFGLIGVRIFNIFFGCLTAWYIYKLALHANLRYAWFAVIPAIFTPIYFAMMSTAMTEVLFSAFLVISIFLFLKEKYLPAAFLISFIFLVRTEGLAYLLLFGIAFLIKRQYKAIPLLLSGFIVFSIVGWVWHFKDFWWLINERPYATGMESVYGSGDWYYFLVRMPLEKIMDNTDFEVVTYFKPDVPFTVLGGYDYKVLVFRKLSGGMTDNHAILQQIQQKEMESGIYHIELFDFEYPFTETEMNARRLLVTDSMGDNYVYSLEGIEFGPTFCLPRSVIHDTGTHLIRLTVDVLLEEVVKENSLLMVFSVEGSGQTYHYVASDFLKQYHEQGVWTPTEFVFTIPKGLKKNTVLKSYIWNINKNKVLIDNLKLELIRQVI